MLELHQTGIDRLLTLVNLEPVNSLSLSLSLSASVSVSICLSVSFSLSLTIAPYPGAEYG